MVQWGNIRMVNTLAAMHSLKGKQIDLAQAFPQAKLKEDIYLRFPAGFEHIQTQTSITKLVPQTEHNI
jgi:hypothetical protein